MPIPKPNSNESESDFVSRCMTNDTMNKEYPDKQQRSAVCFQTWKDSKKEEKVKRDEKGRIIVAENVPIIFNGYIEED